MRRILRWLKVATLSFVAAALLVGWPLARCVIDGHGIPADEWDDFTAASVEIDDHGIPTITAPDWETLVEAQGYVAASDRMFQMELMRRASAGRLSELFGPAAIDLDKRRHLEDFAGQAERSAARLPADAARFCDLYAKGVNRFIEDHRGAWGLEFFLLEVEPEPWSCSDSLLIGLNMAEQLSTVASSETVPSLWREHLDEEWARFLFPSDHPWNEPMFGQPGKLTLPTRRLETTTVDGALAAAAPSDGSRTPGSNSWAWRGPTGHFVANDPHLGAGVPHLWYLMRLRIDRDHWVVGASIAGVPGIVLGMNAHIAWAFTNVGEDVDDYLEERLSGDGTKYLARVEDGREIWEPVLEKRSEIRVRGADPVEVVARFTHRGPLEKREHLGDALYSRQWLPLHDDANLANFWTLTLNRATDWLSANQALDRFTFPAQNVIIMDRAGNMGYRATGTGVERRIPGGKPQPATEGEWVGLVPRSERPRKFVPASAGEAAFLATANQRIWVDEHSHYWANDRRAERIRRVLSSRTDFTREDMEQLQLDTESRYHALVLEWVGTHASPATPEQEAIVERWRGWNGMAFANDKTFAEALAVTKALDELLLSQVRAQLLPAGVRELRYRWRLRDAWKIATLQSNIGVGLFGLDPTEVATYLLEVAARPRPSYTGRNRWQAQHPFVGRVPIVGDMFRVDEYMQWGYGSLVRVERPKFGASLRFVFDLSNPAESTWITPVGQSGHVGSPHYRDLQPLWHRDQRLKMLTSAHDWGLR